MSAARAATILFAAAAAAISILLGLRHLADDAIERNRRDFAASQIEAAAAGARFDSISPRLDLRSVAAAAPLLDFGARAVYAGRRGDDIALFVFEAVGDGYNGEIEFLVGFDRGGGLLDIRVLRHRETPGLGDFIDAEGGARRSIDGVSGATITAEAVSRPARQIAAFLRDNGGFAAVSRWFSSSSL